MVERPVLPKDYEFHHIGCATGSIERERRVFEMLGYRMEGTPFVDTLQGIAGCFVCGPGPRIELLENLPGADTLTPWINAGVKFYHFAYEIDDMSHAIDWARSHRAKVIVQPVPATAFNGRHISFVMFRNGMMLEFIHKTLPPSI
ncbi:MAG TPA: VOC family protein [Nitrospiraceae bacterium]|nr:VOC family protein [Nitrospiraceae bacterium]